MKVLVFIYSITPALTPFVVIAFLLIAKPWGVTALTVGTCVGMLLEAGIVCNALLRKKIHPWPRWHGADSGEYGTDQSRYGGNAWTGQCRCPELREQIDRCTHQHRHNRAGNRSDTLLFSHGCQERLGWNSSYDQTLFRTHIQCGYTSDNGTDPGRGAARESHL